MLKLNYSKLLFICFFSFFISCNNNSTEEDATENQDSLLNNNSLQIDSSLLKEMSWFEALLCDSALANSTIGLYIYDVASDSVLIAHNEETALIPASTMKIVTTGAALEILGGDASFSTKLQYSGEIVNGHILKGNIYIKGHGDPALYSKFYATSYNGMFESWAQEIKKLGIDSVTGAVVGDENYFETHFVPSTWSWGEIGEYYCTAGSALSIYDNRFEMPFNVAKRGIQATKANSMTPYIPWMTFEAKVVEGGVSKPLTFMEGQPYSTHRTVRGTVPAGTSSITLEGSIPDPPRVAAYYLQNAMKNAGIRFGKEATTLRKLRDEQDSSYQAINAAERKTLATKSSPSVAALVDNTNLVSNNLFAETLLNHIGIKKSGYGATEAGAQSVIKFWKDKGVNVSGLYMFDGSGISRYNTVTAKLLVDILLLMNKSPNKEVFFNSLAVSGQAGTLRTFCDGTSAAGNIFAKSGSMSRVLSYSGWIRTQSGKMQAFAFVVNNYNCDSEMIKIIIEGVCQRVFLELPLM